MPTIRGTPLNPPPTTSDFPAYRITHSHHDPKGENPRDYPQEQPNAIAKRDGLSITKAIRRGQSHGSAAHGGAEGNRVGASVGPLTSDKSGVGYVRWDGSRGTRGKSG